MQKPNRYSGIIKLLPDPIEICNYIQIHWRSGSHIMVLKIKVEQIA